MADAFLNPLPVQVVARREVRCSLIVCVNDLDIPMSGDLTKKFTVNATRMAEPQSAVGNRIGDRTRLAPLALDMATVLPQEFTAGGITATGAQILALFNEVIDTYKTNGLI